MLSFQLLSGFDESLLLQSFYKMHSALGLGKETKI